jgi:glycosyltransferase involved in cell wall biosynthesis
MISIILPFRNAAPWIAETISSIRAQDFADWELICINDHSEDESAAIAHSIADERITLLENAGKGIMPALQTGLTHAQGEFITRMDADDIMPSGRLSLLYEQISQSPGKTIATGKVSYFSEAEVSEGYRKYEAWLNERIDNHDHYDHIYRECVIASPNWITRKADLIEHKIFDALIYPEDYHMTFLWKEKGFAIKGIPEVTLHWREHPLRTSRNSDVYDQASFFALKLREFVRQDMKGSLAILGAGTKGKLCASFLEEQCVEFQLYDLEPKRYDGANYSVKSTEELQEDQALIAVYPDDRAPLERFLTAKGFTIGRNAWYV